MLDKKARSKAFGEYIRAIAGAGANTDGYARIVIELFMAAGAQMEPSEESAKKWVNGSRHFRTSKYFPDGEVNESGVYRYFRKRSEDTINALQDAFVSLRFGDIKFDMHDIDLFCWSLLNCFQELLGHPKSEKPAEKMLELFKQAQHESQISAFLEEGETDDEDLAEKINEFIKRLNDDIIECFKVDYSDTALYQKILELSRKLRHLIFLCSPAAHDLWSYYKFYDDAICSYRERIYALYDEICGVRPQFETKTISLFPFEIEDI